MAHSKKRLPFIQHFSGWKSKVMGIKFNHLIESASKRLADYEQNPVKFSAYGKDVRTDWEKAYDLIEGWFFEELLIEIINTKLKNTDFQAKIMGCDGDRVIQISDKDISSDPDIGIFHLPSNQLVKSFELKTAHQWFKELHIKESNIKNLSGQTNCSIIFWALETNEFALLELSDFTNRPLVQNSAWKNKNCYSFSKSELQTKLKGKPHLFNWLIFTAQNFGQEMGESFLKKL